MSTPQQEVTTMPRLTNDQAAQLTWQRLSLEHDPSAVHGLSADIVATTDDGQPVISVIHIEDRRHWNLTVHVADIDDGMTVVTEGLLAEYLNDAQDGTTLYVVSPNTDSGWRLYVDVLELA
jgi:hypothetical protein